MDLSKFYFITVRKNALFLKKKNNYSIAYTNNSLIENEDNIYDA